jgi:manganese transport protein
LVLSLASTSTTGETPVPPGAEETVDERLFQLLVFSQAVLSFQLPFAIIPLVQFTSDRRRMGEFANPTWMKGLAWLCAAIVVGLNVVLIGMYMEEWAEQVRKAGWSSLWIYGTVAPLGAALAGFLLWVTLYPHYRYRVAGPAPVQAPELPSVRYQRIGVAVEFGKGDNAVLAQAAAVARLHEAPLLLIHVVEGPGADYYGPATDDQESRTDRQQISELVKHLQAEGLNAEGTLGFGEPAAELVRIARERKLDFLVLGTHGHRFFADLALGETVSPVLHRLQIPILVVPTSERGVGAPRSPTSP